jgi:uncharacterized membrane protein
MNDATYWTFMGLLAVFMTGFMWFLLAWHDEKVRREVRSVTQFGDVFERLADDFQLETA